MGGEAREVMSVRRITPHPVRRRAELDPRREILALHRRLFRRQRALIDASIHGYAPLVPPV